MKTGSKKEMSKVNKSNACNQSLKKEVLNRIVKLEEETYEHSDNAEDIAEQIMWLVRISEVNENRLKRVIAQEAILLLANHRFGG